MDLIDYLIKDGWLKTERIIKAFRVIKRKDFLPEDLKDSAELNTALPIGSGQTISQPLVVAFMLELLQPKKGEKILDIGSGSGWTTALLAEIVKEEGKVVAIEVIPELIEFGKKNVAKYNFIEKEIAEFVCADGRDGYKKEAPFDKILCSAAIYSRISNKRDVVKEIPQSWKKQLKIGGRIVVPIRESIWLLIKKPDESFKSQEYPGFVFVPLVDK